MEIRCKKSHKHLAPAVPEERHAKKKFKAAPFEVSRPPAAAPPVTVPLVPTPLAPVPKDKGKAPGAIPPVRKSPRFTTEGKLMARAMHAAHVINTLSAFS